MQTMSPPPWPVAPNRIPITRAFCKLLEENGLLTGRYELIDGEIFSKIGQNPPHALAVMLATVLLMRVFGEQYIRCQLSMNTGIADCEANVPEPDVVALSRPVTIFADRHPGPADVLLLVEVSDSTLSFDLNSKALLYARAGIAEYWVADVAGRRLVAYRNLPHPAMVRSQNTARETPSPLPLVLVPLCASPICFLRPRRRKIEKQGKGRPVLNSVLSLPNKFTHKELEESTIRPLA